MMLDHDIPLVRARGCITNGATDPGTHGRSDRTSDGGTGSTSCRCASGGATRLCKGKGRGHQDDGCKGVFQVCTHGCFSI